MNSIDGLDSIGGSFGTWTAIYSAIEKFLFPWNVKLWIYSQAVLRFKNNIDVCIYIITMHIWYVSMIA